MMAKQMGSLRVFILDVHDESDERERLVFVLGQRDILFQLGWARRAI